MDDIPISDLSINDNRQLINTMDNIDGISQSNDQINIKYTLPGSLHFLQTEWARFESERSKWDVEKAELEAKVAFLKGERKGQENLKRDLVRRIKMLEYAIKQERERYNKLKHGDNNKDDVDGNSIIDNEGTDIYDLQAMTRSNTMSSWKQGRQLLREYLHEIGYTDTIIDVRSARVRQIMGIQNNDDENIQATDADVSSTSLSSVGVKRPSDGPNRGQLSKRTVGEEAMNDDEQAVMATFNFLSTDEGNSEISSTTADIVLPHSEVSMEASTEDDEDTEQALAEFDFIVGSDGNVGELLASSYEKIESKSENQVSKERRHTSSRPRRSTLQAMIANLEKDDFHPIQGSPPQGDNKLSMGQTPQNMEIDNDMMGKAMGLGDLAGLTVSDVDNAIYEKTVTTTDSKLWTAQYSLRSHFDSVRTLVFHPDEPVLITGSEDHTLKLWNLMKTVTNKKVGSATDVEPISTFRGHTGPVTCVAIKSTFVEDVEEGASQKIYRCFSGSVDRTLKCWNIPPPDVDPYCSYDSSNLMNTYYGHEAAIWDLSVDYRLLSCSADSTVRVWDSDVTTKDALIHTITMEDIPITLDHYKCDPTKFVVGTASSLCYMYDIETGIEVLAFEGTANTNAQVNRIVTHPSLPLTITAHDDKLIRFYDNLTGKMVHSMVAHLNAVTSLAVDPNGLYLLSGSHDCSIRLWDLENKSCTQEITSHRKKHDEAVHCVAFHSSLPYFASCGADAIAKVFK